MLSPNAHPFSCSPWVAASQEVTVKQDAEEAVDVVAGEEEAATMEILDEETLDGEVVRVPR